MKTKENPLYSVWCNLKQRCNNKNNPGFYKYGGRGIRYCERWEDFKNFENDMGHTYRRGSVLDRIDPNGNYEPSNCRWTDRSTSNHNTRRKVLVTYEGKKIPLFLLCKEKEVEYDRVYHRIKSGWSVKAAIRYPKINTGRKKGFRFRILQELNK